MTTRATVFLKAPAGVAIRTDTKVDWFAFLSYNSGDAVAVTNERGQDVIIPLDNIASVEVAA